MDGRAGLLRHHTHLLWIHVCGQAHAQPFRPEDGRCLRGQRLPKGDALRMPRGLLRRLPGPPGRGGLAIPQRQACRHRRHRRGRQGRQGRQRLRAQGGLRQVGLGGGISARPGPGPPPLADPTLGQRGRAASAPPVAPRLAAAERRAGAGRLHGGTRKVPATDGRAHARLQRLVTPKTRRQGGAAFARRFPCGSMWFHVGAWHWPCAPALFGMGSSPFLRLQGTRGDAAPTPTRHPMQCVTTHAASPPRAPRAR
mmetsp:Transcript_77182/g.186536  ORF Transcript_77182/g.186536 Transcript_77182/m.186536 type:complete len:254 (+) Transcript_77182:316-1077(+)